MCTCLWQCHYSYNACGLGSGGTERLVKLVQEMQHSKASKSDGTLFGAKITGGGSGGSVWVIGRNSLQSSEHIIEVPFLILTSLTWLRSCGCLCFLL